MPDILHYKKEIALIPVDHSFLQTPAIVPTLTTLHNPDCAASLRTPAGPVEP